jgi:hypothetical protein
MDIRTVLRHYKLDTPEIECSIGDKRAFNRTRYAVMKHYNLYALPAVVEYTTCNCIYKVFIKHIEFNGKRVQLQSKTYDAIMRNIGTQNIKYTENPLFE